MTADSGTAKPRAEGAGWKISSLQKKNPPPATEAAMPRVRDARAVKRSSKTCAICGAEPCINPSFCRACDDADARKACGGHKGAALQRARRLLDDRISISLERAWAELNDPRNRATPQVTIEAIMYCVRERGVTALTEPANREPLKTCDAAAKRQMRERIARLAGKRGKP
jgi:hypothetical protein